MLDSELRDVIVKANEAEEEFAAIFEVAILRAVPDIELLLEIRTGSADFIPNLPSCVLHSDIACADHCSVW